MLYSDVVEVEERLRLVGEAEVVAKPQRNENNEGEDVAYRIISSVEADADIVLGRHYNYNNNNNNNQQYRTIVRGPSGLLVEPIVPIRLDDVHAQLKTIYDNGIRSVAISFMHSYAYGGHEAAVAAIAKELGFTQVSTSHSLMPLIKYVNRTTTAVVDSYLTPLITEYIGNFRSRFEDNLNAIFDKVYFIQSDGGLTRANTFYGYQAVLSGPAGGVVGCGATAASDLGENTQTIGFDMGGTSTDVCRCDGRAIDHVMEAQISGVTLQAPQVNVSTVAAGGGSILFWSNGMFEVGPESAGSFPGPACYGRGGPLTVTDANVILGRVDHRRFPKVFGADGNSPLFVDVSWQKFEELTTVINSDLGRLASPAPSQRVSGTTRHCAPTLSSLPPLTVEEVALSFIEVANETMCRVIRNITETKGYRCAEHTLSVFGGAGGQHACAVAKKLGISRIYAHQKASFLSAVGIGMSDIVEDKISPLRRPLEQSLETVIDDLFKGLVEEASTVLGGTNDTSKNNSNTNNNNNEVTVQRYLSLRYEGTTTSLMIKEPSRSDINNDGLTALYTAALESQYQKEFGFAGKRGAAIIVDEVRVRCSRSSGAGSCFGANRFNINNNNSNIVAPYGLATVPTPQIDTIRMYLPETNSGKEDEEDSNNNGRSAGAWAEVPIFAPCANSTPVSGPCLLLMDGTFLVVEHGCTVFSTATGNIVIHAGTAAQRLTTELHPLPLSLFAHRFMSIAEQMGYTLQRTATSTNIKERLDFSCAIFDAVGGLVANAPHIPVHLGAMGATIRWQREYYGGDSAEGGEWREGEVLLSNHPAAGGSHLPDITVMTPCFIDGKCAFYVASRGHHADVGGITPGSMPPFSTTLDDEGAHIKTFKLVENGIFQEEGIAALLMAPGARAAGHNSSHLKPSGCRMLNDVLADLRAQVAANYRGVLLMKQLVASYGLDVVSAYMGHIQDAAEKATRTALRDVVTRANAAAGDNKSNNDNNSNNGISTLSSHHCIDTMDDGTSISLRLAINADEGSATFDFSDSGPQVLGSTNCPKAVVASAVIYSLRCLISRDIPLNEGCLKPVTIITRQHSILEPSEQCAVVAGNVLTSQRVTDVILRALHAAACSQGCMNNLTMGNHRLAYYETIGGGAGATEQQRGADAVQVHMTNTRMTDAEVFEERYPVLLRRFAVRKGSGGIGRHRGGNGIERSILFLTPMSLSLSTERRAVAPKGFLGGGDGAKGINLLRRSNNNNKNNNSKSNPQYVPRVTSSQLWSDVEDYCCFNVGGKCTIDLNAGDSVVVATPGGGGFGRLIVEDPRDYGQV